MRVSIFLVPHISVKKPIGDDLVFGVAVRFYTSSLSHSWI